MPKLIVALASGGAASIAHKLDDYLSKLFPFIFLQEVPRLLIIAKAPLGGANGF